MMTTKDFGLTKTQFIEILSTSKKIDGSSLYDPTRLAELNKIRRQHKMKQPYDGRLVLSMLFPKDLYYRCENKVHPTEPVFEIKAGAIISGGIDKKLLNKGTNSLIHIIHKEYGLNVATNFINNIQFVTNQWLLIHGFTIGLDDCMVTSDESVASIQATLNQCYTEAQGIEKSTHNPGIREVRVTAALSKAKDIGMRIAKDAMKDHNHFLATVNSGAKGDYFNIAQITGLLGQQNIKGRRITPLLNNGTRTLPHYPMDKLSEKQKYESLGFIKHSFIRGLNPQECYFHAMSGREGVCDTAMGTAESGYSQRRILKLCEDLHIAHDGTIRNVKQEVASFSPGINGYDTTQVVNVNGEEQFCNIDRLVNRLNKNYEMEMN